MGPDDPAGLGRDRRQVDDSTPAAAPHPSNHGLRHKKRGLEVRIENDVPVALGNLVEALQMRNPGVVHENIDGSEAKTHLVDQPGNLRPH